MRCGQWRAGNGTGGDYSPGLVFFRPVMRSSFLEFAAFAQQFHALITGEHSALGFSGTTDFQAGML